MLKKSLKQQTAKTKHFWTQKCEQLLAHEAMIEEKDAEIAALKVLTSTSHATDVVPDPISEVTETSVLSEESTVSLGRQGKAPPVDAYTGSDPELQFDDWLPTLERAAKWNNWSDEEKVMQLAGHLRGKAAREYSLLSSEKKQSFTTAVQALQVHLDLGSCGWAAQEFRNAVQMDKESVSDYITRLERSFQIAYGQEYLSIKTRDAFLFSQLQAGLKLTLIESPAVSGSTSYKQLCITAKQEKKRQRELRRLRQQQDRQIRTQSSRQVSGYHSSSRPTNLILDLHVSVMCVVKQITLQNNVNYAKVKALLWNQSPKRYLLLL